MYIVAALAILSLATTASGQSRVTAETNYNPVTITVSSAPFDILATPITPDAPYSQARFQCNVTGDSRYPPYATGTFPLNVSVPVGQRVRVIFANGNLNGATVTQQGEPGVIVQQGGSPIVQQLGGASPIVQRLGSPVVQSTASPAARVQQTGPTVVQQNPSYQTPAPVPVSPPVVYVPVPVPATPGTPTTPAPTPITTAPAPGPVGPTPVPTITTAPGPVQPPTPAPTVTTGPITPTPTATAAPTVTATPDPTATATAAPTVTATAAPTVTATATPAATTAGRKLLQDSGLVPGGPNNGLVEYVALASANTVSGFYAGSTQFGVPYVEFTATEAVRGLVASFRGVLEVAQVVGGVPLYPFRPNPSLSPECQVNVNFRVA